MGYLHGIAATLAQVVSNCGGYLRLASLVQMQESIGYPAVQLGAPGGREPLIEMADNQGMPEVLGNTNSRPLLCQ